MSQRKALITGVLGQDGAYLARFLLDQGYQLHGLLRWDSDVSADARYDRFAALGVPRTDIQLHMGDILDSHGMLSLVEGIQPDEVMSKLMDSSAISALGWRPETPLSAGLKVAYDDYVQRFHTEEGLA